MDNLRVISNFDTIIARIPAVNHYYTINEMTEFCDGLFAFICLAFASVSFLFAHFRYGLSPLHAPPPPRWLHSHFCVRLLYPRNKISCPP